jgi:hypothetical protein
MTARNSDGEGVGGNNKVCPFRISRGKKCPKKSYADVVSYSIVYNVYTVYVYVDFMKFCES